MPLYNPTSTSGTTSHSVITKTSGYTITTSDDVVLGDASGGAFTLTLPTAVGITGKVFRLQKKDTGGNRITIATTSAQTINGLASAVVKIGAGYDFIDVISDGSNWLIYNEKLLVGASAYRTTNQAVNGNSSDVIFDTVIFDTTGDYNASTGIYTVSRPGRYRISGSVFGSSSTRTQVHINGSAFFYGSAGSGNNPSVAGATTQLNAADTVSIRDNATETVVTASGMLSLHIERIGNL